LLSTRDERRDYGAALINELLIDGEGPLLDADLDIEVSDENPVSALIGAARRHSASAIVIGSQHHSRLQAAVGTVAGGLLGHSPVPVIAVPSPPPVGDD
jgi:nucleotide-binding universal stress UspA family protein